MLAPPVHRIGSNGGKEEGEDDDHQRADADGEPGNWKVAEEGRYSDSTDTEGSWFWYPAATANRRRDAHFGSDKVAGFPG